MNREMTSNLGGKNTLSPIAFKDLCEATAIARAARYEYFAGKFRSGRTAAKRPAGRNRFRDMVEILTAARARRSEYFNRLMHAWFWANRPLQGK